MSTPTPLLHYVRQKMHAAREGGGLHLTKKTSFVVWGGPSESMREDLSFIRVLERVWRFDGFKCWVNYRFLWMPKSLLFLKIESERFGPKVLCCCRAQMKTRARSFSCKTRSCGLQERTRLSPPRMVITMTLHQGLAKGTACRTCPLAVLLQVSFSYPGSRTEAH